MGLLLTFGAILTWVERKQAAIMSDRIGANRAYLRIPFTQVKLIWLGLFHGMADGLKLLLKEDFKPIAYTVTGGQYALPLWLRYMEAAHPPGPPRDFAAPPGIYFVRAVPDTGLLVPPGTPGSVMVPFRRGTVPSTHVAGPTPKPGQKPEEPSFEDVQF